MPSEPSRTRFIAIDTAEIDPADPAGSFLRTRMNPRPAEPDVELELVTGCNGELELMRVVVDLGGGRASYREVSPFRGAWVAGEARVFSRGVDGARPGELDVDPDFVRALEAPGPPAGARELRDAAGESYIPRLIGLLAEWLVLDDMGGSEGARDACEDTRPSHLRRALTGRHGPPVPRSRRGRVREVDPENIERLRDVHELTHSEVADRLSVAPLSPAKATYRSRRRRESLLEELDRRVRSGAEVNPG